MQDTKEFYLELQHHLWKAELEFRAKKLPEGSCVDWLGSICTNTKSIATFLRQIGFKIAAIVDEESCIGEGMHWVVTTGGIVVYVNTKNLRGFVARGRA